MERSLPFRGVVEAHAPVNEATHAFEQFTADTGAQLRRALVARFGIDVGNEVTSEALAYAWEHWLRVSAMDNPTGYLYRVGMSAARRHHRWQRTIALPPEHHWPVEPGEPTLPRVLNSLSARQRVCVVLVHVHDWTYQQTADATGLTLAAVTNHVHRGLHRLRHELKERP